MASRISLKIAMPARNSDHGAHSTRITITNGLCSPTPAGIEYDGR
jgi:hypothetical protein